MNWMIVAIAEYVFITILRMIAGSTWIMKEVRTGSKLGKAFMEKRIGRIIVIMGIAYVALLWPIASVHSLIDDIIKKMKKGQ